MANRLTVSLPDCTAVRAAVRKINYRRGGGELHYTAGRDHCRPETARELRITRNLELELTLASVSLALTHRARAGFPWQYTWAVCTAHSVGGAYSYRRAGSDQFDASV